LETLKLSHIVSVYSGIVLACHFSTNPTQTKNVLKLNCRCARGCDRM